MYSRLELVHYTILHGIYPRFLPSERPVWRADVVCRDSRDDAALDAPTGYTLSNAASGGGERTLVEHPRCSSPRTNRRS